MRSDIKFILNGNEVVYSKSATARLLDVLRDEYMLRSVKCGCKEGECGACSVLIDGVLTNSCCVAMGSIEGKSVLTMEGYRQTERFKVLSDAFASVSTVQCGFCMPGMALAAESILSKNPHPSEEEIRVGISGNLCRCTGYNSIVKAIEVASQEGNGIW